jgi:SAM-dependent methyltransferase
MVWCDMKCLLSHSAPTSFMNTHKHLFTHKLWFILYYILCWLKSLPERGNKRWCPVCKGSFRRFLKVHDRLDAMCPFCGALERHRLSWLYISSCTNLFDGYCKRMLHIAPESCFVRYFETALGNTYIKADRYSSCVSLNLDVERIPFAAESFDVVYCSHVLEHVPDDRAAIREFYRILRPGGWAILLVPITAANTFEENGIPDPRERLRLFGQEDHVRCYGIDYVDRLREAGFSVDVVHPHHFVESSEMIRMGLTSASGEIFFCRR